MSKQKGVYLKYIVSRVDGTPIDPDDVYFVLKLNGKGDRNHINACRGAVLKYAELIKPYLPDLTFDIVNQHYARLKTEEEANK
jgi:hypothetical protein